MPRTPLIRSAVLPYHVTIRCNNREWFYAPMNDVWDICQEVWMKTAEMYRVELHCLVLMSNHLHLAATTPEKNLDVAMRYFLTEVARRIQKLTGRINHIFGARYKWTIITDPIHWLYAYKYVLRNPVRAGICSKVEDYPYSTIHDLLQSKSSMPIVEGFDAFWAGIPKDWTERLNWLNRDATPEMERVLSLALRRATFQITSQKQFRPDIRALRGNYLPPCG